jgi:hypothetical protein
MLLDGRDIVIVPSKSLIQKYNLCLSPLINSLTKEGNVRFIKTQIIDRYPKLEYPTITDCFNLCLRDEQFIESVIVDAMKLRPKTIYCIIVSPALCLQNGYSCPCVKNKFTIFLRHSREEQYVQFGDVNNYNI